MAKLNEIKSEHHEFLKMRGIPWFSEATNQSGLAKGGVYLLSGPPGGGKTTLAMQIAVDLACVGQKVLYLALEQSPSDLKQKVERQILPFRKNGLNSGAKSSRPLAEGLKDISRLVEKKGEETIIGENLLIDANVSGMEGLPDFLARHVLGEEAQYSGVRLIIVDSLQGLGTAPTSSKPYQRLFEFNRWTKEHGITVVLVGHITKGGAIAGPRSLEHNVDCVLYLRKAMRLRPLFVPKNRFGAERHEPLSLIMNDLGCLEKSRHVKPKASQGFGFLPGDPGDLIEVQALVKLPKYGDKAGIKAPYLPRQKLQQLVGIVSSMHDIDISDLTFEINCAIPGGRPYHQTLDLPLAMSMLASYFQREISMGTLFVGELDLFQSLRPLSPAVCEALANALSPDYGVALVRNVDRVFLAASNEAQVADLIVQKSRKLEVIGIDTLDSLVEKMWPDVIEKN